MSQVEMYEPNDIENEMFLSQMPLNLIEEAIKSQFNDPIEDRKSDYVQSFLNKYEFSLENMREDDQMELDELHDDFVQFMKEIIYDYLSVGIPNIEDMPEENQHKVIHYTYRFFITNIKRNFTNLVWNYIQNNKAEISAISSKKKDVISLNFKSEISDSFDILILSNLYDIVNYVLSTEFTVDEFFKLAESNDLCLELEYLKSKYADFSITGNFVPNYISMIDRYFRTELESKIRNRILKKYPKRKREFNNEEDVPSEIDES